MDHMATASIQAYTDYFQIIV